MKRRLLVLVASCALAAMAFASTAGADPTNARNSLQLQAVCGTQTYNVVVNGNGEFTPAHLIGSTSVFIPTAFNITSTFTPTGGSTMTETDTSAKTAPLQNTIDCTIPFQIFSSPFGTFTIEGTVTGFLTPR
jgi:uncharacterized secreted protein with C-terminal beta-propeller domain